MKSAMQFPPEGELIADGKIHRYEPGKSQKSGSHWYVLFSDGDFQAGSFGQWVANDNGAVKWCSVPKESMDDEQKAKWKKKQAEIQAVADKERRDTADKCAEWCQRVWDKARPADENHPYLTKKKVPAYGLKQLKDMLMVPARSLDGKIHTIQFIKPDGSKVFKKHGILDEHFHVIGKPVDDTLLIAEGYSTSASLHIATGHGVLVAFNAGNIKQVALYVKKHRPNIKQLIAVDDDKWAREYDNDGNIIVYHSVPCVLDGKKRINTGIVKGTLAAEAVGGSVVKPVFADLSTYPTDFNDLHCLEGLEAVRNAIEQSAVVSTEYSRFMNPTATTVGDESLSPTSYSVESPIDDDTITQLARMSRIMYDQNRKDAARSLGIRTSVLDEDVRARRRELMPVNSGLMTAIDDMNKHYFVSQEAGKTYVYKERFCPLTLKHYLDGSEPRHLVNYYLNQKYEVDEGKYDSLGNIWMNHSGRLTYQGIILNPNIHGHYDGYYNMWRGFAVDPVKGDWTLLKRHIMDNVCNSNKILYHYLIRWMATAVQRPDNRAGVAVVMKGGKGVGKSIVADHIMKLFGRHGMQITSSKYITGNFNAHLRDKILLFADEAFWAGDKQGESALKGLITESTITIEGKGKDAISVPNMLHVMMASNAEWVVPASPDERRFFVLQVADYQQQNQAYFDPITEQMENGGRAAMLHDLLNIDLTDFKIRSIPATDALTNQKLHSLDDLSQWWLSCLESGRIADDDSWNTILVDKIYDHYLLTLNKRSINRRSGITTFGIAFRKLLPEGYPRKVREQKTDGSRPTAYQLPALKACREHFEKILKTSLEWVDDGDGFI